MQLNRCIVLLGQLNRLTRLESYNCRKRNLIEALSYVSLSLYSEWVLIFWRSTDILYLIYIYIWNLVWFARAISRCEGSRCWFSNNSLNAFRIRIRIRCRSPHAMPIEVKLSQNYVHIRPPNSPLKTRDPRRTHGSPAARSDDSLATPWEISEAIDRLWLRLRVASRAQVKAPPHPPRMCNYIYTILIYVRILLLDSLT